LVASVLRRSPGEDLDAALALASGQLLGGGRHVDASTGADRHLRVEDDDADLRLPSQVRECFASGDETQKNPLYSECAT
jgi:hypothetical protein